MQACTFKDPREFKDCYLKQCERRKISTPTKFLAHQTDATKLVLPADRIKVSDWEAICSALLKENLLKTLSIVSAKKKKDWLSLVDQSVTTEFGANSVKGPAIFTRYVLEKVVTSVVKALLRKESSCESLHLELPLNPICCRLFSQGIAGASKLRNLSLRGSCVGDEGLRFICDALRAMPNLRELDFSECNLGVPSVERIVELVKCHGMILSTIAWESSFRYRVPEVSSSIGLVRLSLNKNPGIGDEGARKLAEAIKDDICLRGLDLQGCRISNDGATALLGLLMHNKSLQVVDVRANEVSYYVLDSIQRALQAEERVAETKKALFKIEWLPLTTSASK
ncbi:Hypothetical predicted protein [Cloeon dipterum]|uniref:Uncharacterized protein n=1 Tax=Cloeon dipterum TaxID=197152 RepID=A0A8S1DGZ5_9INSE|nr:Hypothetical predicted protein [Cloeon dipterum]